MGNRTGQVQVLRDKCIAKYGKASNKKLEGYIQDWMDVSNQETGYLPGLDPDNNVTQLEEIVKECHQCKELDGNCTLSQLLRNMAALETLLQLLEANNNTKKADETLEFIKENYGNYYMLKEFTNRICDGKWHTELGV